MINIKSLLNSRSVKSTIYVGIGSILGSFFSYLLQFVLGRKLSLQDFGTFNALLSLLYILSVPSTVLSVSVAKGVSEFFSNKDFEKLTDFYKVLLKYTLITGSFVFLLIFILRNIIATSFKIEDSTVVIIFGVAAGLVFISSIPFPYFQGLLRFKTLSFYVVTSNFLRFLIPTVLVYAGFKVYGVFAGMGITIILCSILAYFLLRKNFTKTAIPFKHNYSKVLMFGVPVFFVTLGMVLLNNLDMILVKNYFNPELSGYYAGTLTMGKILLFGSSIVISIMFPTISGIYSKKESYIRRLKQFALIQILVVSVGLVFFTVVPEFLTRVFFGLRFSHSVTYLPAFSIFVAFYVLVNFMVMFLLSIDQTKVSLFLIPGIASQFLLITFRHNNLFQIIEADIAAITVSFCLLLIYSLKVIRQNQNS